MTDASADYRCYRHGDREAYIRCQRCERFICPDCMRDASVGFQCPSCVTEGAKTVRQPRTRAGAGIGSSAGAVTKVLIAVNVAVFVLTDILRIDTIVSDGALTTVGIYQSEYWRLFTSAFIHYGLIHLAFNMLVLYLFGTYVESILGTWRYLSAYFTMALGGSAVVYWLSDVQAATAGASGAIAGLFGLALLLQIRHGEDIRGFLVLIAANVLFSLRDGVSWQGHLGGFLAGLILGAAFAYAPRGRQLLWQITALVTVAALSVLIIALRTHEITVSLAAFLSS